MAKTSSIITQKEQKLQVSAIPELKKSIAQKSLLKGVFNPGVFGDMLKKSEKGVTADAEVVLTPDKVLIRCGETIVHLTKSGDVIIKTPKGKGKIVLNTQEVKLNADKNFVVNGKATNIDTKTFRAASNLEVKK